MARLPRLVVPSHPHHVLQRGHDRQPVFRDTADYAAYLEWLREAAKLYRVAIHAYVLMPNHIHLLVSPSDGDGLGRMMQWIGRFYVPYFNHKYGRVGTLWEGRFKASVLETEQYCMACCRYIELNPVRAGLTASPEEYPWSSYMHHAGIAVNSLIVDHPQYWALGNTPFEREAVYRALVEQGISQDALKMLNQSLLKGWALGSENFKTELEKQVQRRVQPAKRGRKSLKSTINRAINVNNAK
ncbi:MAG: transposase [Pseudomonadota bacterium]